MYSDRDSKALRTRKYIIEQTAGIFNRKGFYGTSLRDLTEATGLTKGSIYGNFKDKEAVAREAFLYAAGKIKRLARSYALRSKSYSGKLLSLIDFHQSFYSKPPVEGGCAILNSAVEADDNHPELKQLVAMEVDDTIQYYAKLYQKAIDSGELKTEYTAKQLAYTLFASMEGALMMARVKETEEPMKLVLDYWRAEIKKLEAKGKRNGQ